MLQTAKLEIDITMEMKNIPIELFPSRLILLSLVLFEQNFITIINTILEIFTNIFYLFLFLFIFNFTSNISFFIIIIPFYAGTVHHFVVTTIMHVIFVTVVLYTFLALTIANTVSSLYTFIFYVKIDVILL